MSTLRLQSWATTLHVAKQLGRKAIGCDISEKACRLAESRLAQEILVI